MANAFLKILIRAIRLKYELVYIDESKIQQINSNLHCWRKNNEYLFNDIKDYQKRNLIMAISPNGLIYYKITSDNTNTDIFMNFFNGLLNKIGEERKKNSIFILDNCKIHISYKMIKYYHDNKINILTTVPYFSPLNFIELSFKKLKLKLYKNLYSTIDEAIQDTEKILNSESFKKSLKNQYYETLCEYKNFIKKYF